jgi:hypothetical protein
MLRLPHRGAREKRVRTNEEGAGMSVDSLQITEKTDRVGGGPRKFARGRSGNPQGRPKGSKNRKTLLAELLLDGEAERLTRKAVDLALDGSEPALRLCLDRLIAPRREPRVAFALPPIAGPEDIITAMAAITGAVADGRLSPGEAYALSQTVDTFLKAIDAREFERRLTRLEAADAARR